MYIILLFVSMRPFVTFSGVYLPLLWEQSFCWKSPIALGYTRGHFSALVAMETNGYDNRGAGANLNTDDDVTVTLLPLVDSERKLLQIHFLSAQEVQNSCTCLEITQQGRCVLTNGVGGRVALSCSLNEYSFPCWSWWINIEWIFTGNCKCNGM